MKIVYGLILLGLLAVSCRKEKASWENDWSFPIVNDTLTLESLVNDSTLGISGGDYILQLQRTIMDIDVAEFVPIPDTTVDENYSFPIVFNMPPGGSFANDVDERELDLGDMQLKVIEIRKGYIDVTVDNPLVTEVELKMEIPGALKDGITFSSTMTIPRKENGVNGIGSQTLDLSGYRIDLTGASGASYNKLQTRITLKTSPTGPSVTMTPSDITHVTAKFHSVKLNYARGYFGQQSITEVTSFDFPTFDAFTSGNLMLSNPVMNVELSNGLKAESTIELNSLKSTNVSNSVVNLIGTNINNSIIINPATGNYWSHTPSTTNITFSTSNSNIEDFIGNMGNKYTAGYKLKLNPFGNISGGWNEMFPDSRIRMKVNSNFPLQLGFNALAFKDTFDFSVSSEDLSKIVSGKIRVSYANGFAVSLNTKLQLLDASGTILSVLLPNQSMQSGELGTTDVNGIKVSRGNVYYDVPKEVIDKLSQVTKIIPIAVFNSPDLNGTNQVFQVQTQSYLGLKIFAEFKMESEL